MNDLVLIGTDENGIETYVNPHTNDIYQQDHSIDGLGGWGIFKKIGKFIGNGAKFAINNSGISTIKKKITGKNIVRNSKIKGVWGGIDRKAQGFRNAQGAITLSVAGGAAAKKVAQSAKYKDFVTKLKPIIGKGTFGNQLIKRASSSLVKKIVPKPAPVKPSVVPQASYVPPVPPSYAPQGFNPFLMQQAMLANQRAAPQPQKPVKDNTPLIVAGVVGGTLLIGGIAYAISK